MLLPGLASSAAAVRISENSLDLSLSALCLGFFAHSRALVPVALLGFDVLITVGLDYLDLRMHKRDLHALCLFAINLWWILCSLWAPSPSPFAMQLVLLFLGSVLKVDAYLSGMFWGMQLLASLPTTPTSLAPLFLQLVTGVLELDCNAKHRAVLFPEPVVASSKPSASSARSTTASASAAATAGGGSNAVHRLFMKAFGNYDQFSREVTRYVREVQSGLGKSALLRLNEKEIDFSSFELERKLASGGFCTVFRGRYTGGKQCAVKSFSSSDQLDSAGLCGLVKEIVTLIDLEHPNIIRAFGYCWLPQVCLVMEYMPKGTLHDMLVYRELDLGWDSPLTGIAIQISDALSYLHTRTPAIIHRDLKARNILMKDFRTCKLADFGLLTEENSTAPRAGTLRYVAPEVSSGEDRYQQNKPKSDIWSLGVCFWEMATRSQFSGLPFVSSSHKRILFCNKLPYPIPMPLYEVIDACLEPDPDLRTITALEIKERLLDCLDIVLSEDRSSWFSGDVSLNAGRYSVIANNDLSVDASQAWRLGSAMWRNSGNMRPVNTAAPSTPTSASAAAAQKKETSSRSLEAAIRQAALPPPNHQHHGGLFSRLENMENRTQAEAYEKFAGNGSSRGMMMDVIPELGEGASPSSSKQSLKSWDGATEPETPPFSELRRALSPPSDAATNRFLARMEPRQDSFHVPSTQGMLSTVREESNRTIDGSAFSSYSSLLAPSSPTQQPMSMMDRLALAEREAAGRQQQQPPPSEPELEPEQEADMDQPKTLVRAASAAFASEGEYAPVDYNAMFQQASFLSEDEPQNSMLGRLAMAEKETSRSLGGAGGMLSRLGQAERETSRSLQRVPSGRGGGMLARLGQAERETSRSLGGGDTQLLDRIKPKSVDVEEVELKGMRDRLDRVEKQTSRSLFAKFESSSSSTPPFSASDSVLLARMDFDHFEDEGMVNRLDRAEKQTSRSLFAKFESASEPLTATTTDGVLLARMDFASEDEGMVNRLDRVEKQTSRSLFDRFQQQQQPDHAPVPPLLDRIQMEEDEGMINRLDRLEKQTSRSLFAKLESPAPDLHQQQPLLDRLGVHEDAPASPPPTPPSKLPPMAPSPFPSPRPDLLGRLLSPSPPTPPLVISPSARHILHSLANSPLRLQSTITRPNE